MNCFDHVEPLLDRLYPFLDIQHGIQTDSMIVWRLDEISKEYARLRFGEAIKYSDVVTRFGYLYKYVAPHASFLSQIIMKNCQLQQVFDREMVTIMCLGGGPGSDILGIHKFLAESGKKARVRAVVLDREPSWGTYNQIMAQGGDESPFINIDFKSIDVTASPLLGRHSDDSHLYTMMYLVSELCLREREASCFFADLFDRATPGSLFLFVDNAHPAYYSWLDRVAKSHQLTTLGTPIDTDEFTVQNDEYASGWRCFHGKLSSHPPKLSASIAYRIYCKR